MPRRSKKWKLEKEDQTAGDGKRDNFMSDEIKNEIETLWEIPQICHFLYLTRESLNIPQFSIYEMERMLLIPRASKQLANIMTCLLSSPITKAKLRKIPPMPYKFWTNILAHKMKSWVKIYHVKHKDPIKVLETIGVEPEFWNIFPNDLLLENKDFEDLSFKQRIWLLKTVCDTIMHTRRSIQEDLMKQPWQDQFETILGFDRYGARYIYFPQFISTDLRIYRHCLDNKILSTVKPVTSKKNINRNNIIRNFARCTKKELELHNSSPGRSSRYKTRTGNKDFNSSKINNDSAFLSFICENTNSSSTCTCSDNDLSSEDITDKKRCESLSKTSEESTLNARSSGYDTNTYNNNKLCEAEKLPQQMFKGFSDIQKDTCNTGIINGTLESINSTIAKVKVQNEKENDLARCSNDELVTQPNREIVESHPVNSSIDTLIEEKEKNEKSADDLPGCSKTDDEKLNDIISADICKLTESLCSKSVLMSDNVSDSISVSTSKSDDEKLNETKTDCNSISENGNENNLNDDITFNWFSKNSVPSEQSASYKNFNKQNASSSASSTAHSELSGSILERTLRSKTKLQYKDKLRDNKNKIKTIIKEAIEENTDLKDDKTDDRNNRNSSRSKTRWQEMEGDSKNDYTSNSDIGYNLRSSKRFKMDKCKQYFNQLLSDLSVSDFQLIVDSVEGLRNLISSFSASSESNNTSDTEVTPISEIKLVNKLNELLKHVETTETTLKDVTRKARSKLQREWSNFKEGIVEDQDSSSEGGLSSNWWVLGSQGCPLPAPGDATLQTLPQPALSSLGSQDQQSRTENENDPKDASKSTEQSCNKSQKSNDERRKDNEEQSETKTPRRKRGEKKEEQKRRQREEKAQVASTDKNEEQQTRRVLRARGVSSYTEQLYPDYEIENELEEWTDVEAVYAAPGSSTDTPASNAAAKTRCNDDWSEEEEDSDQDWILPGSRKRKNKRSFANRRLKWLNKLQNDKKITSPCNIAPNTPNHSTDREIAKNKLKNNQELKGPGTPNDSTKTEHSSNTNQPIISDIKQTVPSTDTTCNIETVSSVHSELDIKDEGPIYESSQCAENNQDPNLQQNYVMIKTDTDPMNYYVINPSTTVTGIIPQPGMLMQNGTIVSPVQQSYYVQGAPSYVIQNPQPNFSSDSQRYEQQQQQQQQHQPLLSPPIFQQQNPQIMAQPFVHNAAYVPYVLTAPPQPGSYNMFVTRPSMTQDMTQSTPRPQNRFAQVQNTFTAPQQNLPFPNGAVIRSNAPFKGTFTNSNDTRTNVRQRFPKARQKPTPAKNTGPKTTSLIVLSDDSDDEIEMIVTENTTTTTTTGKEIPTSASSKTKAVSGQTVNQSSSKPSITSDIIVSPSKEADPLIKNVVPLTKDVIPPQIIERMNQGGISITPIKNTASSSAITQLVVVLNETGSHYALALPNGSKLILTPEQVAQIRASNGGKLSL